MKGHPTTQLFWTNQLRKKSRIPLMVSMDAEWGLSMRLDSVIKYPRQMALGALQNDSLIYEYGREMGRQLKMMGVDVSFSPVADINSNPENPVINVRSFGEDKLKVARKSIQYMRGLQDEGILAVVKHFPGHGDTHVDSHKDLPLISRTKNQFYKEDLFPFRRSFEAGVGGVMSAHIQLPAFEKTPNTPASLSKKVTQKLLRKQLKYGGLCFSDALSMGAVTNHFDSSEIDVKAFLAGNDILLFPQNIPAAIREIKKALKQKRVSQKEFDARIRRILAAKYWTRQHASEKKLASLHKALNSAQRNLLNYQIGEKAITLLRNEESLLPLNIGRHKKLISLALSPKPTRFQEVLGSYGSTIPITLNETSNLDSLQKLLDSEPDVEVVISLHNLNSFAFKRKFGLDEKCLQFINQLMAKRRCILVNFSTPYALTHLKGAKAIVQAYEEINGFHVAAAQVVHGAISPKGKLPVTVPKLFRANTGLTFFSKKRLKVGLPEQEGLHSEKLAFIDSVVNKALAAGATPGCQVLVAKNNRVVYQKAFGYHTYDSQIVVSNQHYYDIASISKIMASTACIMWLYDQGKIDIYKTLGDYLGPEVDSLKAGLTLKEVLAHQSGLAAWIPFYVKTLVSKGVVDSNYCPWPNGYFGVQVAESLYTCRDITDTIYNTINKSELKDRGKYLYSDLGYFYLKKIIEKQLGSRLDTVVYEYFFEPLGLNAMYNPLDKVSLAEVVPTENDEYFRNQLIHGYVHDPAAAMLGGVAGHAGVFSSSWDLAVYMQMLLNRGEYGGKRYLKASTIDSFTKKQFPSNRKGLGFDKPEKDSTKAGPAIRDLSPKAFGHSGFTGTCVWSDPEYNITYVFLSNRVHPTAANKKLVRMNVRTDILQVIYDDLLDK